MPSFADLESMLKDVILNGMYNWSTDEKQLKGDPKSFAIWRLEQLANFGLNGEKISELELKKHWDILNIDPARKKFLEVILYGS